MGSCYDVKRKMIKKHLVFDPPQGWDFYWVPAVSGGMVPSQMPLRQSCSGLGASPRSGQCSGKGRLLGTESGLFLDRYRPCLLDKLRQTYAPPDRHHLQPQLIAVCLRFVLRQQKGEFHVDAGAVDVCPCQRPWHVSGMSLIN